MQLGLRLRIFLATMAVIAALLALTYGVMRGLVDRVLEAEVTDSLVRARRAQASFCAVRHAALLDQARSVAQAPYLRAVLGTPGVDESTVHHTITSLGEQLDAALLFACDARGTWLADTLGGGSAPGASRALARALDGFETCDVLEHAGEPFLVALSPVTLEGAVLGLVGLGYRLERHARDLGRVTGLDVTLMRGERVLATAWEAADAALAPPVREPGPWARLSAEENGRLACGEREYMATAVRLEEAGGEPGPRLVLSRPLDDVLQPFQRARRELIAAGLSIALHGRIPSQWIAARNEQPIRELTTAAAALARGELATAVDVRSADEVGVLARTFNGMARRLDGLMREATEKARAAEQASEAKSVFLATMSHEIRTPLNGVLGFAEQLLAGELGAEQREQVGHVQRSGQDLLAIIDEILDFARLEAGEARLEESEFHLSHCLERALDPLRPAIAAKGLALALEVEPDVPEILLGPALRLRQIVANYAGNALKFTARGAITVRARLAAPAEGDATHAIGRDEVVVRVSVQDTGIGIPAADQRRLFQPFAQLDSGANREYGGTGLGLAVSKELARLMRGEVGVESAPGVGSTFWFTTRLRRAPGALPAEAISAPSRAAGSSSASPRAALPARAAGAPGFAAPEARARRAAQRVLVAEDNPVNQRVVAAVLARAGWPHALVANGAEALERVAAERFDLVLMDVQMPRMDGLEATRRIRALERGRRVPIVALTANAFAADREACLAAGMDDFLAKPFRTEELVALLDRHLAAPVS